MKALKVSLLAAAASLVMGGAASAQDEPFSLSFNIGAASDYVFRGVSQTDNEPQIYGGADATIGSIGYAGIWVSNVEFNNGTEMEYDLYAGLKPVVGGVTLDLAYLYYGYTNQPDGPEEGYSEFKAAASMPVGPATIGASLYYSPDFFAETGPATYFEVNGSYAIPDTPVTISGALGYQEVEGPFDYTTWNLGVGYAINEHIGLDLRYHDTSEHDFGDLYDAKLVAGIKATF
jgi:uncharacterized protein (TIGR02001 family)